MAQFPGSVVWSGVIIALSFGSPPAAHAQPCPPGTFKYGPVLPNSNAELIVLDHYGPGDPLVPILADYQRAVRDVDLIYAAIPDLEGHEHSPLWPTNRLLISTAVPSEPKLGCTNAYYLASMQPVAQNWWQVNFPRSVNVPGAAARYLSIQGVQEAVPDSFGATSCDPSRWTYQVGSSGTWRWDIVDYYADGFGRCRFGGSWVVVITSAGAVTVTCYADCDGVGGLNANDFQCFLNKFVAGDSYADCDGIGGLTGNDFQCFLNAFVTGCT